MPVINNSDLLTFIPRRDTTSLGKTDSAATGNSRRYLLVAYNPLSTTSQRKAVSRIFQRTPLIRLKPGIVLLPQIRTRRFRLYSPSLLRPSEFISRILELGADVCYASRLELVNPTGDELLIKLVRSQLQIRSQRIITGCRSLYTQLKAEPKRCNHVNRFNMIFVRLRSQMRLFRKQTQFFQNEFGIVFSHLANRVASAVTRVGHRLSLCDAWNVLKFTLFLNNNFVLYPKCLIKKHQDFSFEKGSKLCMFFDFKQWITIFYLREFSFRTSDLENVGRDSHG